MAVLVVAMAVAVGVWLITRAAARGYLGANGAIGIRTTATQRSEEAWVAGHRAALPLVRAAGLVVALAGLTALVVLDAGRDASRYETTGLVLLVSEMVVVVVAAVVAHRAASRVPAP